MCRTAPRREAYGMNIRTMKLLAGGYLAVNLATVAAIVLLRNDTALVTDSVWTRGVIVAASSVLTYVFAVFAARGSGRAYLRLRLVALIQLVAIVAIIALPGTFPLWMKIEQGVCGLLLLGLRPWSRLDLTGVHS